MSIWLLCDQDSIRVGTATPTVMRLVLALVFTCRGGADTDARGRQQIPHFRGYFAHCAEGRGVARFIPWSGHALHPSGA